MYKYTISTISQKLGLNMVVEKMYSYERQYNVLSTIRINHMYTKSSINSKIYEWYLIDNLNYQAIPIKCGNIGNQYNI